MNGMIVDIAVSGDIDPFTLKQVSERVRDELTAIPEITQVDLVSAPPNEIEAGSDVDVQLARPTWGACGRRPRTSRRVGCSSAVNGAAGGAAPALRCSRSSS